MLKLQAHIFIEGSFDFCEEKHDGGYLHQLFAFAWPFNQTCRILAVSYSRLAFTARLGDQDFPSRLYQASYKIDVHSYKKADLHRKQCYGSQRLRACIMGVTYIDCL